MHWTKSESRMLILTPRQICDLYLDFVNRKEIVDPMRTPEHWGWMIIKFLCFYVRWIWGIHRHGPVFFFSFFFSKKVGRKIGETRVIATIWEIDFDVEIAEGKILQIKSAAVRAQDQWISEVINRLQKPRIVKAKER